MTSSIQYPYIIAFTVFNTSVYTHFFPSILWWAKEELKVLCQICAFSSSVWLSISCGCKCNIWSNWSKQTQQLHVLRLMNNALFSPFCSIYCFDTGIQWDVTLPAGSCKIRNLLCAFIKWKYDIRVEKIYYKVSKKHKTVFNNCDAMMITLLALSSL